MFRSAEGRRQSAGRNWLRAAVLLGAFCTMHPPLARAQIGQTVTEVAIEEEGRPVTEPTITALIETRLGSPLDAKAVRETIAHIMSLNRYDDVQVLTEEAGGGVRVRYVLAPLHPVDTI